MKTINISIDWFNEDSIKAAEKAKKRAENSGYSLINHFGGMQHSVMIYGKKN